MASERLPSSGSSPALTASQQQQHDENRSFERSSLSRSPSSSQRLQRAQTQRVTVQSAEDRTRKEDSSDENSNTYWPSKIPPPEVLDRLGSSITVRCRKLPRAQYTFQWTKSYRLKPSWKDAEGGICREDPEFRFTQLEPDQKYEFRVKVEDPKGNDDALVSPPCTATTLSSAGEAYVLYRRNKKEKEELERKYEKINEVNTRLQDDLHRNQQEMDTLQQELDEKKEKVSTLEKSNDRLQSSVMDLQSANKQLEQKLKSAEERYNNLLKVREDEKTTFQERISQLYNQKQNLSQKYSNFVKEVQELYKSNESIRKELRETISEKEKYEHEVHKLRGHTRQNDEQMEHESDTATSSQSSTQYTDYFAKVKRLERELERVESEKENYREEVSSLREQTNGFSDNNVVTRNSTSLEQSDKTGRLENEQHDLGEREEALRRLEAEKDDLEKKCTEQASFVSELQAKVNEKDRLLQDLGVFQDSFTEQTAQTQKLNDRLEETEEKLRYAIMEKDTFLETLNSREAKVTELEEKLSALESEASQLREENTSKSKQLDEAIAQESSAAQRLQNAGMENESMRESLQWFRNAFVDRDSRLNESNARLSVCKEQLAHLEEDVNGFRRAWIESRTEEKRCRSLLTDTQEQQRQRNKADVEHYEHLLEQERNLSKEFEARVKSQEAQIEELKQSNKEKDIDIRDVERAEQSLERERKGVADEISHLLSECEQKDQLATTHLERLYAALRVEKRESRSLRAQVYKLLTHIESVEGARRERPHMLQEELEQWYSDAKSAKALLQDISMEKSKIEKKLAEQCSVNSQLTHTNQTLQESNASLEARVGSLESDQAVLDAKLDNASKRYERVSMQKEDYLSIAAEYITKQDELYSRWEDSDTSFSRRIVELEHENRQYEIKLEEISTIVSSTKNQVEQLNEDVLAKESDISKLQTEVRRLTDSNENLTQEYSESRLLIERTELEKEDAQACTRRVRESLLNKISNQQYLLEELKNELSSTKTRMEDLEARLGEKDEELSLRKRATEYSEDERTSIERLTLEQEDWRSVIHEWRIHHEDDVGRMGKRIESLESENTALRNNTFLVEQGTVGSMSHTGSTDDLESKAFNLRVVTEQQQMIVEDFRAYTLRIVERLNPTWGEIRAQEERVRTEVEAKRNDQTSQQGEEREKSDSSRSGWDKRTRRERQLLEQEDLRSMIYECRRYYRAELDNMSRRVSSLLDENEALQAEIVTLEDETRKHDGPERAAANEQQQMIIEDFHAKLANSVQQLINLSASQPAPGFTGLNDDKRHKQEVGRTGMVATQNEERRDVSLTKTQLKVDPQEQTHACIYEDAKLANATREAVWMQMEDLRSRWQEKLNGNMAQGTVEECFTLPVTDNKNPLISSSDGNNIKPYLLTRQFGECANIETEQSRIATGERPEHLFFRERCRTLTEQVCMLEEDLRNMGSWRVAKDGFSHGEPSSVAAQFLTRVTAAVPEQTVSPKGFNLSLLVSNSIENIEVVSELTSNPNSERISMQSEDIIQLKRMYYSLRQELATQKDQATELRQANDKLNQEREQLHSDLKREKAEKQQLITDHSNVSSSFDTQQASYEALEREKNRLEERFALMQETLSEVRSERSWLEEVVSHLEEDLKAQCQRRIQADDQLRHLTEKVERKEENLKQVIADKYEFRYRCDTLDQQVRQTKNDVSLYFERSSMQSEELTQLQNEKIRAQEKLEANHITTDAAQHKNQEYLERIEQLNEEISRQQTRLDTFTSETHSLKEKNAELRQNSEALGLALEDLLHNETLKETLKERLSLIGEDLRGQALKSAAIVSIQNERMKLAEADREAFNKLLSESRTDRGKLVEWLQQTEAREDKLKQNEQLLCERSQLQLEDLYSHERCRNKPLQECYAILLNLPDNLLKECNVKEEELPAALQKVVCVLIQKSENLVQLEEENQQLTSQLRGTVEARYTVEEDRDALSWQKKELQGDNHRLHAEVSNLVSSQDKLTLDNNRLQERCHMQLEEQETLKSLWLEARQKLHRTQEQREEYMNKHFQTQEVAGLLHEDILAHCGRLNESEVQVRRFIDELYRELDHYSAELERNCCLVLPRGNNEINLSLWDPQCRSEYFQQFIKDLRTTLGDVQDYIVKQEGRTSFIEEDRSACMLRIRELVDDLHNEREKQGLMPQRLEKTSAALSQERERFTMLSADHEAVEEQRNKLRRQVANLSREYAVYKESAEALTLSHTQLMERLALQSEDLSSQTKQKVSGGLENAQLRATLDQLRNELSTNKSHKYERSSMLLEEIRSSSAKQDQVIEGQLNEVDNLRSQLRETEEENDDLFERKTAYEETLNRMHSDLRSNKEQIDDLQNQVDSLDKQLRKKKKALKDLHSEKLRVEEKKAEQEERIKNLENKVSEQDYSLRQTVSQKYDALEQYSSASKEIEELQTRLDELDKQWRSSYEDKERIVRSLETELQKNREQLEQKESAIAEGNEQIGGLEEQVSLLRDRIQVLESELRNSRSSIEQIEAEKGDLQRVYESVCDELERVRAQYEEERGKSEQVIEEYNEAMRNSQAELDRLQQEAENKTEQLKTLELNYVAFQKDKEDECSALRAKLSESENRTEEVRNSYSDVDGQLRAKDEEIQKAMQGYIRCATELAHLYENTKNPSDLRKALHLYQQMVDAGSTESLLRVGAMYERLRNPRKAMHTYKELAEKTGDKDALFRLALMDESGRRREDNFARSVDYCRKAAEAGHTEAQYQLGLMCELGYGVECNKEEAARFYSKAATGGHLEAMFNLAWLYEDGSGIPVDEKKAFELYKEAANAGHSAAQCKLGTLYESGLEVAPTDVEKSFYYYRKAADSGHIHALRKVAELYETGIGRISKDLDAALRYYEKAKSLGDKSANAGIDRIEKLVERKSAE
eukprot:gb/GECG01016139.1/.p1 GENE.gb/GECG01016139.1/~~gb/GECG01016139.1/.p1  ORF type:complete len:2905 (+),score=586.08 gb/GECG01016139.1/:1-8715(+)